MAAIEPQLLPRIACSIVYSDAYLLPSHSGLLFIRSASSALPWSANRSSFNWSSCLCMHARAANLPVVRSSHGMEGNTYEINLNEYMLTLDKPTGIRFAHAIDGNVYVEALARHGNAERSKMVMVGDILKKVSAVPGEAMWDADDLTRTMHAIRNGNGPLSLVLERPTSPADIQRFSGYRKGPFNSGKVSFATWNGEYLISDLVESSTVAKNEGKVGFLTFSSRFLQPKGLKTLAKCRAFTREQNGYLQEMAYEHKEEESSIEFLTCFSDEEMNANVEWSHGDFSLEDYTMAVKRAEKDLCYNHLLGMQIRKITGEIYVGSCIQTVADVQVLAKDLNISAVLNFQCKSERDNWGIDGESIKRALEKDSIVTVDYPIREVDSVDLRRKLPTAVAVLYRLLRQEHRVFVTCTTGLDRSPACVIAYLHWIRDVSLHNAFDFIQSLHPCGPDRPALVWATWDLVAMAENGNHKGPPTHSVQFVWNHGCREGEEVILVGDFRGGWNEPIKLVHAGGQKYAVDLRLPQGKYYYKFIVGGQWRHSHSLPTEGDQYGNVNNVIHIGGIASTNIDAYYHHPNTKSVNNIKVIERPLTEDERFTLAFAARRLAFSISPLTFRAKK